jgi:hypothetical protein
MNRRKIAILFCYYWWKGSIIGIPGPCMYMLENISSIEPRFLEITREGTTWEGLPLPPGGRDPPPPEVNA